MERREKQRHLSCGDSDEDLQPDSLTLSSNSPWDHKELDMTEQLSMQTHMLRVLIRYFT